MQDSFMKKLIQTIHALIITAAIFMPASAAISFADEIAADAQAEPIGAINSPANEEADTERPADAHMDSPMDVKDETATDEIEAAEDEEQALEEGPADTPDVSDDYDYTVEEGSPCDCGASVPTRFDDVLFETNSYEISDDTRYMLDALAVWLMDSGTKAYLFGHGDDLGSDRYNEYLGFRRAMVIKDHLISNGVDGLQIEAESLGESAPACKEDLSDECRAKNRRVSFRFSTPQASD